MKRGLKVRDESLHTEMVKCYNRYPDEKGTESPLYQIRHANDEESYNRYPDEKGTERLYVRHLTQPNQVLQPLPR